MTADPITEVTALTAVLDLDRRDRLQVLMKLATTIPAAVLDAIAGTP